MNESGAKIRRYPFVDQGLCRCCGVVSKCRILNVEYEWLGRKEVYADIFVDTFGLFLSQLDVAESERLICATCVLRLRDATAFRQQVISWEERLSHTWMREKDVCIDNGLISAVKMEFEQAPDTAEDEYERQGLDVGVDSDISLSQAVKDEPIEAQCSPQLTSDGHAEDDLNNSDIREKTARRIEAMDRRLIMRERRDLNQKSLENTITIVENSYVYPFDSLFSNYYCFYCKETFTDPNKLKYHTDTHNPDTFKDRLSLNYYDKKTPQLDITRIDCRLCSEQINNIEKLKIHLAVIHNKKIHPIENEFLKFKLTETNLTCVECGSIFPFFHALIRHMAEHFGSCICDACGARFFDEAMLVLHRKTHDKIELEFPCTDCGKIFKSKRNRFLHEARKHKMEAVHQCNKCDMVFLSRNLRYRHLIESHGEQCVFRCGECDKSYDSRSSLRQHHWRVHRQRTQHACSWCDRKFYERSRLREHMAKHTGERNFGCEYCGKSYPSVARLKAHLPTHNKDKVFKCPLCDAAFTLKNYLRNHLKRYHKQDRLDDFGPVSKPECG